jgi:outer membrane protein
MKKPRLPVATLLLATLLGAASSAQAQTIKEGPWMTRVRIVNFQSANNDGTAQGLGVDNKLNLTLGGSYYFSKTLALELELAPPQVHQLSSKGNPVGSITLVPLTVSLQYHLGGKKARPYVGLGLNYTTLSGVDVPAGMTLSRSGMGLALQAGLDVPIGGGLYANVDIKKSTIATDITSGGVAMGTFKLDPWLLSAGMGYRF